MRRPLLPEQPTFRLVEKRTPSRRRTPRCGPIRGHARPSCAPPHATRRPSRRADAGLVALSDRPRPAAAPEALSVIKLLHVIAIGALVSSAVYAYSIKYETTLERPSISRSFGVQDPARARRHRRAQGRVAVSSTGRTVVQMLAERHLDLQPFVRDAGRASPGRRPEPRPEGRCDRPQARRSRARTVPTETPRNTQAERDDAGRPCHERARSISRHRWQSRLGRRRSPSSRRGASALAARCLPHERREERAARRPRHPRLLGSVPRDHRPAGLCSASVAERAGRPAPRDLQRHLGCPTRYRRPQRRGDGDRYPHGLGLRRAAEVSSTRTRRPSF